MPTKQLKTNNIYCGDNLVMFKQLPDNCIDLIYIDPPFNSNRNYEIFWGDKQERRAFDDRFGDAEHYIRYMRPRIVELHRVLKPTGSFYYHCDWHASHYIKIMLDQIFDFNNFLNEIIWRYRTGGNSKQYFARKHDSIFSYTKHFGKHTFNVLKERSYLQKKYNYNEKYPEVWDDERNMWFHEVIMRDVWTDIEAIGTENRNNRRLGYPTQKPLELLNRIIQASSNEGDVVLDAFCGCGTTLISAQKLGRKWLGIDIAPTACRVVSQRLGDEYNLDDGVDFEVIPLYKSEHDLLKLPPFEFQDWACIALGAIPNKRKVNDYGIDGKLYPADIQTKKENHLYADVYIYYPVQVKQKNKAGRPDIDSFAHAMRRDFKTRGYFIAFGFSQDAMVEIKRVQKEDGLEIIAITVAELLRTEGG